MAKRITLDFLKRESASGVILSSAALLGVILANSPWAHAYFGFIEAPFTIRVGAFEETLPVLRWITEGLLAIFFFVLGLEIKYEATRGELANPRRLALPVAAALGGLAVPALAYLAFTWGEPAAVRGWPIVATTDIGFALAALAVAGSRLPPTLRTFLLTVAILEAVAAVAMIGLIFTDQLRPSALGGAAAALSLMALLGRWRAAPYLFYAVGFALVWAFTLKSGLSTAVAGVAAAMTIPLEPRKPHRPGVLEDFMESLHPYVAFLILPLFAFSAAGFSVAGLRLSDLFGPVALGVAAGLFLGNPLGVFGATALVIGLKLARRPTGARWVELYGVSLLCGVGFTLSLFIGGLVFPPENAAGQTQMRVGVIAGSLLSLAAGMAVLAWAQARRSPEA